MDTTKVFEVFWKLLGEFCFGGSGLILVCLIIGLMLPGGGGSSSAGDINITINQGGE